MAKDVKEMEEVGKRRGKEYERKKGNEDEEEVGKRRGNQWIKG